MAIGRYDHALIRNQVSLPIEDLDCQETTFASRHVRYENEHFADERLNTILANHSLLIDIRMDASGYREN